MSAPTHLLTPRDWAATKRMQACDVLGTPEANTLLCDARKFDMLADEIVRLNAALTKAKDDLAELARIMNP